MLNHTATSRFDWNEVRDKLRAAQTALEQSTAEDSRRKRQVFRDRANRLAAQRTDVESTTDLTRVLVFRIGEETYGIELRFVAKVFPDVWITPVPGSPDVLLGIANLQGDVRSVLGLRHLLRMPECDDGTPHYILLLCHDGRTLGLRVEQIEDVRQIALDELNAANDVADQSACYIQGLASDRLIVLRTEALFEELSPGHDRKLPHTGDNHLPETTKGT